MNLIGGGRYFKQETITIAALGGLINITYITCLLSSYIHVFNFVLYTHCIELKFKVAFISIIIPIKLKISQPGALAPRPMELSQLKNISNLRISV